MALTKIKNITVTTGEYKAHDGEIKKRYQTIGSVFEREDGSQCFKLDSIPIHADWDGWGNLYDPKPYQKQGGNQSSPPQTQTQPIGNDDDIPF
tara:strand:+ start:102 stop:380 length:279 start_codon:yes stop_codon:yes gene_type:complete